MTMKVDWMRGCATALVTPFKADGAFDEERMQALVERQIDGGVRLLVPCGTTGESATMTEAEDKSVIGLTVQVARGRAKVIAEQAITRRGPQSNTRKGRAISAPTAVCQGRPITTRRRKEVLTHTC